MSRALLLGTNQGTRTIDLIGCMLGGYIMDSPNLAELFANLLFNDSEFEKFKTACKSYEDELSNQIEKDIESVIDDLSSERNDD